MRSRVRYERELARELYRRGWAVIRAPASGARNRSYPVPDLIAVKNGFVAVFEVKTTKEERAIYIPKRQVMILKEWLKRAGAEAFIAVKVMRKGWYFFPIETLKEKGETFKLEFKDYITLDDIEKKVNV